MGGKSPHGFPLEPVTTYIGLTQAMEAVENLITLSTAPQLSEYIANRLDLMAIEVRSKLSTQADSKAAPPAPPKKRDGQ